MESAGTDVSDYPYKDYIERGGCGDRSFNMVYLSTYLFSFNNSQQYIVN